MKLEKLLIAAVVSIAFSLSSVPAPPQSSGTSSTSQSASLKPFLGRWDLTLKAPDREWPSWIEITQQNGHLSAQFVSRWGNARSLPRIEIAGTRITFVSPKEEEDRKDDMVFKARSLENHSPEPLPVKMELPGRGPASERPRSNERARPNGASRLSYSMEEI